MKDLPSIPVYPHVPPTLLHQVSAPMDPNYQAQPAASPPRPPSTPLPAMEDLDGISFFDFGGMKDSERRGFETMLHTEMGAVEFLLHGEAEEIRTHSRLSMASAVSSSASMASVPFIPPDGPVVKPVPESMSETGIADALPNGNAYLNGDVGQLSEDGIDHEDEMPMETAIEDVVVEVTHEVEAMHISEEPVPTPTPEPIVHEEQKKVPEEPPAPENKSWASLFKSKGAATQNDIQGHQAMGMPATTSQRQGRTAPPSFYSQTNSVPKTSPPIANSTSRYKYPPLGTNASSSVLLQLGDVVKRFLSDPVRRPVHQTVTYRPRGLTNRGNWCFVNSVLQALVAVPPFHSLLRTLAREVDFPENLGDPEDKEAPIVASMTKFIQEFPLGKAKMRSNKAKDKDAAAPAFEPTCVYKVLRLAKGDVFKVEGRQEDAEEFMSFLLNGLHEEILEGLKKVDDDCMNGGKGDPEPLRGVKGKAVELDEEENGDDWLTQGPRNKSYVERVTKSDKTPISDIFRGEIRAIVASAPSGRSSTAAPHGNPSSSTMNLQPFFCLPLDIQSDSVSKVEDAVQAMTATSQVDRGSSHQLLLESLPPVLILHLKMFVYDIDGCHKVRKQFRFGPELEIRKEWISVQKRQRYPQAERTYKLIAVIWHDGAEATKGHYVADTLVGPGSGWVRHDDASVDQVPESLVWGTEPVHKETESRKRDSHGAPTSASNSAPTRVPYLLIYRRSDTFPSKEKHKTEN